MTTTDPDPHLDGTPTPTPPPRGPVHHTAGHAPSGPLLGLHPGTYIETRIPAADMTLHHLTDFTDAATQAGLHPDTPGGVLAYSTTDRGTAYLVLRATLNTPTPNNDTPPPEHP